jgi:hypothetical protein
MKKKESYSGYILSGKDDSVQKYCQGFLKKWLHHNETRG